MFLATDRYLGAVAVVFPLAMGLAIQATSWITVIGIGISKRSYLHLYAYSVAIAATLTGIWLLAPLFGLLGVGLGVLLGQVMKALISSWLAQRAYRLPWHYTPVIIVNVCNTVYWLNRNLARTTARGWGKQLGLSRRFTVCGADGVGAVVE